MKYVGFFTTYALLFLGAVNLVYAVETIRIYPGEGAGGVTVDGRMFEDRYTSWEQTRNSLAARIATVDNNSRLDISNVIGNGNGASFYSINRLHFGFDTSLVPDNAILTNVIFSLHGSGPDFTAGDERRIYVVSSNPESNNNLVVSDYSKVGNISFGVTDGTWSTSTYTSVTLNETGKQYINKNGVTNFALRGWYDFNDVVPTNDNELYIHLDTVEAEGTSTDPYLEITYEVPEEKTLEGLIDELVEAVKAAGFPGNIENSYLAHLEKLQKTLGTASDEAVKNQLEAFIMKLEKDHAQSQINETDFEFLKELAEAALEKLEEEGTSGTDVPLVTQVDPLWANEIYAGGAADKPGHCGATIKQCGCSISSMSMLAGYYDVLNGVDGSQVNPSNMNVWLNENDGYVNGSINWTRALMYLGEVVDGKVFSNFEFTKWNEESRNEIDNFIKNTGPVVAYNEPLGGSHYFIAAEGDGQQHLVRDPNWFNTMTLDDAHDAANHVMDYDGEIKKANLFTFNDQPKLLSRILEIQLASPAELLLTDSKGRRTGYDAVTGEFLQEIPGSSYEHETAYYASDTPPTTPLHANKRLMVLETEDDFYSLEVIGTGDGEYEMLITSIGDSGVATSTRVVAEISDGARDEYVVTLDGRDDDRGHGNDNDGCDEDNPGNGDQCEQ